MFLREGGLVNRAYYKNPVLYNCSFIGMHQASSRGKISLNARISKSWFISLKAIRTDLSCNPVRRVCDRLLQVRFPLNLLMGAREYCYNRLRYMCRFLSILIYLYG